MAAKWTIKLFHFGQRGWKWCCLSSWAPARLLKLSQLKYNKRQKLSQREQHRSEMTVTSHRHLTHLLWSGGATGMMHSCIQSVLNKPSLCTARMALARDICMSSPASEKEKIPYLAASEAAMIIYLFIELNPRRDSSWQSFSPARRLGGTIWPLWRRIIPDSEILETAVSLHCGANTKAVPWGSAGWVRLLLSDSHGALQGSTGGRACEMKKDTRNKLIIINIHFGVTRVTQVEDVTHCCWHWNYSRERWCVSVWKCFKEVLTNRLSPCGSTVKAFLCFILKKNAFLCWSNIGCVSGFGVDWVILLSALVFCLLLLLHCCFRNGIDSSQLVSSGSSVGDILIWQWNHQTCSSNRFLSPQHEMLMYSSLCHVGFKTNQ